MINRVVIGFGWWIVMVGALSGRLFGGGKQRQLTPAGGL
jgi:hypothetical protein